MTSCRHFSFAKKCATTTAVTATATMRAIKQNILFLDEEDESASNEDSDSDNEDFGSMNTLIGPDVESYNENEDYSKPTSIVGERH